MRFSRHRIPGKVYGCGCSECLCRTAVPELGEVCEDCGVGLCRGKARITIVRREVVEAED